MNTKQQHALWCDGDIRFCLLELDRLGKVGGAFKQVKRGGKSDPDETSSLAHLGSLSIGRRI